MVLQNVGTPSIPWPFSSLSSVHSLTQLVLVQALNTVCTAVYMSVCACMDLTFHNSVDIWRFASPALSIVYRMFVFGSLLLAMLL